MYSSSSNNHMVTLTDEDYVEIMRSILVAEPCLNTNPNDPTLIMDRLYLGSQRNAEAWPTLERLRVTHVLNCAGFKGERSYEGSPYEDVGIEYLEFQADDHDDYDITRHFNEAFSFIDRARHRGGVVLVHCALGINRSGATCIAYLMLRGDMPLLKAVKSIKSKRRVLLSNRGFQRRLVKFARKHDMLDNINDSDEDDLRKFVRKKILNKPRSHSSEQNSEEDIDTFIERCRNKNGNVGYTFLENTDDLNDSDNYSDNFMKHNGQDYDFKTAQPSNRELIFKYIEPIRAGRASLSSINGPTNGPTIVRRNNYKHDAKYYNNYEPLTNGYNTADYQSISEQRIAPSFHSQSFLDYQQPIGHYQPTTNFYPPQLHAYEPISDYKQPIIYDDTPVILRRRNGPKVQHSRRSANVEEIPVYKGNEIDIYCTANSGYEISVSVPQKNKLRRSMSLTPRFHYY